MSDTYQGFSVLKMFYRMSGSSVGPMRKRKPKKVLENLQKVWCTN